MATTHRHALAGMPTSSGFGPSSRPTVRRSSAIPQIGQAGGSSRTISGCIGHVYSTRIVGSVDRSGPRATPHFGHAPGCGARHDVTGTVAGRDVALGNAALMKDMRMMCEGLRIVMLTGDNRGRCRLLRVFFIRYWGS